MPKSKNQQIPSIWDVLDKPAIFTGEHRKLVRPVIHIKAVILSVVVHLMITGLISFLFSTGIYLLLQNKYSMSINQRDVLIICSCICYFFLFLIRLKKILIFLVLVYQAKASDEIRLRCSFVPSCSEYMILSLKKYGAVFGFINGAKRLSRCKNSYGLGGEDYP